MSTWYSYYQINESLPIKKGQRISNLELLNRNKQLDIIKSKRPK